MHTVHLSAHLISTHALLLPAGPITRSYFKNGLDQGVAFSAVADDRLFPCVGLRSQGEEVRGSHDVTAALAVCFVSRQPACGALRQRRSVYRNGCALPESLYEGKEHAALVLLRVIQSLLVFAVLLYCPPVAVLSVA